MSSGEFLDLADHVAVDTWPSFATWTDGFTAGRPPRSVALDGHELVLHRTDGAVAALTVTGEQASWQVSAQPASGDEPDWLGAPEGTARAVVLELPRGIFLVDLLVESDEPTSTLDVSLVVDRTGERVLVVQSWVLDVDGATRARSATTQAGLGGALRTPFERTTDLVGRRALWRYSNEHAYEHIYLNAGTYVWHCLGGPERSIADVDRTETYRVSEHVYAFFVTETVMPTEGLMLLDFTPSATRNVGRFFGWDPEPDALSHSVFGARGRILNETRYDLPDVP